MRTHKLSRRKFLGAVGKSAGVLAFPTIVPRAVFGDAETPPPSEQMTTAVIGLGWRGGQLVGRRWNRRLVAVCDVHRERVDDVLAGPGVGCDGYTDFRRIIERPDIGHVVIATPPHWHAVMARMAVQAGKDVFCEKPLAHSIHEGRAFVEAVRNSGCGFQYGALVYGLPMDLVAKAYRSRLLGWPLTVYQTNAMRCRLRPIDRFHLGLVNAAPEPVPEGLDWDLYCGPAPLRPYQPHRYGKSHRGYWDYEGGALADWGPHNFNALLGALDKGQTSPVEAEAEAPPADEEAVGVWNTARVRYADGTVIVFDSGRRHDATRGSSESIIAEGPNGALYCRNASGGPGWCTDPPHLMEALRDVPLVGEVPSTQNLRDPVECVTHAHHVMAMLHLVNIAIRVGRRVRFDPVAERVVGDEQAQAMIHPPMRAPWQV
jgi:predicted dehydrogenase